MRYRPCDRCGAVEEDEFDSESDSYHPMCVESAIAYGVLAWLCFDCRKSWHKLYKSQHLTKEYSEASLKFEFWKSQVSAGRESNIDEGLTLWKNLDLLEIKLNNFANEWLISDVDYNSPNSNTPH